MTITKTLSTLEQNKLLKDIKEILTQGRLSAIQSAQEHIVLTYWEIGQRISQEQLSQNSGYTLSILQDISKDLSIDLSTLKRCLYFFQTYKSAPRGTKISWAQYRELITISNNQQRAWYEDLIQKMSLNRDQLVHAIKNNQYGQSKKPASLEASQPKLTRPTASTYIYKAFVERVVDGDTLLLRIDLGFQVQKLQRVRLNSINTPEKDSKEGLEAFHYVRDALADVSFVMVKTHKIDIYGRYLGDIFYSPKHTNRDVIFAEGQYLNQELLDEGLGTVI